MHTTTQRRGIPMIGGPFDGDRAEPHSPLMDDFGDTYGWPTCAGRIALYKFNREERRYEFDEVILPDDVLIPDWQI